ncbi:CRISPR-associated ring nuclease Csm6 [Halomonas sp.]|uniref:CRISPR-associated ring nuclease Csm6 n=1 Tax=Halomonas sp. TaxID=1486246 RepID=UPI00384A9C05
MPHILLAVTGMSPQVVTETLYGMVQQGIRWPDHIQLITTTRGEASLREGLFEHGHLAALCRQLGKPTITEENVEVLVVPGASGQPVEDARTVADHEALADFIMNTVRRLTADDSNVVHASIAGGRKTMTFYLGYAMSLFGRPGDRMSHVLVSEGYEGLHDFYFPTRESQLIHNRDGDQLDAREARVSLADIPFIRQRDELPTLLREPGEAMSFRKLVDLINLGDRPEDIGIELHAGEMRLDIFDGQRLLESVDFGNRFDWTWYQVVVTATRADDASLKRGENDRELAEERGWRVMEALGKALDIPASREMGYRNQLKAWLGEHEQTLEAAGIRPIDFDANLVRGLDVSQVTNRINHRLKSCLPERLAAFVTIGLYFDPATGQHLRYAKTRKRGGGYGVSLGAEQIRLLG